MNAPVASPQSRARRGFAQKVLVAGLLLMGVSALGHAVVSASSERSDLQSAGSVELVNGKARRTYVLPEGSSVLPGGTLMVAYRFPQEAGDMYVLGCRDHAAFRAGQRVDTPNAIVLRGLREGMLHEPVLPLMEADSEAGCAVGVFVVLEWRASSDWRDDPPSAVAELVQNPTLEGPAPTILSFAFIVGLSASLAAWFLRFRASRVKVR